MASIACWCFDFSLNLTTSTVRERTDPGYHTGVLLEGLLVNHSVYTRSQFDTENQDGCEESGRRREQVKFTQSSKQLTTPITKWRKRQSNTELSNKICVFISTVDYETKTVTTKQYESQIKVQWTIELNYSNAINQLINQSKQGLQNMKAASIKSIKQSSTQPYPVIRTSQAFPRSYDSSSDGFSCTSLMGLDE